MAAGQRQLGPNALHRRGCLHVNHGFKHDTKQVLFAISGGEPREWPEVGSSCTVVGDGTEFKPWSKLDEIEKARQAVLGIGASCALIGKPGGTKTELKRMLDNVAVKSRDQAGVTAEALEFLNVFG